MNERKIVVPEGMLKAACRIGTTVASEAEPILEAALRWLSENPIVPGPAERNALRDEWDRSPSPQPPDYIGYIITWWQRRMFLAPEEALPEEIADLLHPPPYNGKLMAEQQAHSDAVIKAYRLGKEAACQKP